MDSLTHERLMLENEALRRRVAALEAERDLAERRQDEALQRITKLERVLREIPILVDIFDVGTARSVFKNRGLDELLGYAPGALEAMGPQPTLYKTIHADDLPRVLKYLERIRNEGIEVNSEFVEYRVNRGDGAPGWFRSQLQPFQRHPNGGLATTLMVTHDVTETKLAENALRALNEELDELVVERTAELEVANVRLQEEVASRTLIAMQAEERARLIRELSSPVLRIWDGIIAVPLIGTLDSERATMVQEAVLQSVATNGIRSAILDLTGVGAMDAETVEHLGNLVAAVALLGARVIVSGVGPRVARVMVENGLSLQCTTVKNLREALRYCIARKGD